MREVGARVLHCARIALARELLAVLAALRKVGHAAIRLAPDEPTGARRARRRVLHQRERRRRRRRRRRLLRLVRVELGPVVAAGRTGLEAMLPLGRRRAARVGERLGGQVPLGVELELTGGRRGRLVGRRAFGFVLSGISPRAPVELLPVESDLRVCAQNTADGTPAHRGANAKSSSKGRD